jgi:hypothetical protein
MRNDSDVQHGPGDKCDDASDIGPVEHDPNGDNGVSYEEPHYGALEGEDIETAGIRIIPLYSMWTTMQDLKKAVAKYGLAFGFQVCSSGWSFTCNKAGFTRQRRNGNIPEEKQRQGSRHLKVGCSMCVKFSFQDKTLDGKVDKSGRVRVTYSKFAHSSTCTPSANQLVVCRRASGDYSKLSQAMVASILSVLKNDPGVSTRALRAMLAPAFPKRKHISALEIFNMKVRVKLMHEETEKNGAASKYKVSMENIFMGLDDDEDGVIDVASQHVHDILRAVLRSTDSGWKVIAMLEKLHAADPGFTYRISRDPNGFPQGFVWMTSQMRASYELFGNFISIDAMKRQQNSYHWPYIGPCVYDENKTVAVIAESIVCAERHEAYKFVLGAIFEMAPRRPKSQINVVASDCFVTPSLLSELGISNSCHLMWDHYHILESIWPKKLGVRYFSDCRPILSRLLNARTDKLFDTALSEIRECLSERPDLVSYMVDWAKDKQYFAAYLLDTYPGSMFRRGSQASEVNHSSFQAAMGSGLNDDPAVMLQKTILRQSDLNRKRNERIATYICKSARERHLTMEAGNQVASDALKHLSSWGHELWVTRFQEASHYESIVVPSLEGNNNATYRVSRIDSFAEPRLFPVGSRCGCNSQIAFMFPCAHEICAFGMTFHLDLVAKRWMKRTCLAGSMDTGPGLENENNSDDGSGGGDNALEPKFTANKESGFQDLTQDCDPDCFTQPSQGTRGIKSGYTYLMSLFQGLAQAAAGTKFETVVAGVALQMTSAIEGRGHIEIGCTGWDSIVSTFSGILETYQNAFSGTRRGTVCSNDPAEPATQPGRPQTKRLISNVEKATTSNKRRKNVVQTCGFCGSNEHMRMTSCPIMAGHGKKIVDLATFQAFLLETASYTPYPNVGGVPLKKTMPKEGWHIIIHQMFSTCVITNGQRPRFLEVAYEATMLGKDGSALPHYSKVAFEGQAIWNFIAKIETMKGRFLFSTVGAPK